MKKCSGFTLIELVIAMVVLGVVALASSDFLRSGSLIYRDAAGRQVLLGEARFAIARLSREIENSLPNSAQLSNSGNCLTFIPAVSSNTYIDLPLAASSANSVVIASSSSLPIVSVSGSVWASVYALSADELLNGYELLDIYQLQSGNSAYCDQYSCKLYPVVSIDTNGGTTTLQFENKVSFSADSPSQRLYLVSKPVSYCVSGSELRRYQTGDSDGWVTMASKLSTESSEQPFQIIDPSLTRNGLVRLQLVFSENNEQVEFDHDIVVFNQP